jgi:hypothetical protein
VPSKLNSEVKVCAGKPSAANAQSAMIVNARLAMPDLRLMDDPPWPQKGVRHIISLKGRVARSDDQEGVLNRFGDGGKDMTVAG